MPIARTTLAILALTLPSFAERTRNEVTKATTPEGDAKPNSDMVPEAIAISGQFQRIVILRFKYQTDLLAAFEKQVAAQKIKNAVILSGVGSVRNYHIHSVSNRMKTMTPFFSVSIRRIASRRFRPPSRGVDAKTSPMIDPECMRQRIGSVGDSVPSVSATNWRRSVDDS